MIDIETLKMYQLIEKYKPDNYTTCSPEDTIFINNYIDGIYTILCTLLFLK